MNKLVIVRLFPLIKKCHFYFVIPFLKDEGLTRAAHLFLSSSPTWVKNDELHKVKFKWMELKCSLLKVIKNWLRKILRK